MKRSYEIGSDLEDRVAAVLKGERVKQSGGGKFWKLDVNVRWLRMVVSCKATTRGRREATPSIRITKELILEARRGARGVTGTGDGYEWAIVGEVEGIAVFVCELDTAAALLTASPADTPRMATSKGAERRARTRR